MLVADNTKKVADFDLPEQSLVVIELGDDPNGMSHYANGFYQAIQ